MSEYFKQGFTVARDKIKSHAHAIGLKVENWGDDSVEDCVSAVISAAMNYARGCDHCRCACVDCATRCGETHD